MERSAFVGAAPAVRPSLGRGSTDAARSKRRCGRASSAQGVSSLRAALVAGSADEGTVYEYDSTNEEKLRRSEQRLGKKIDGDEILREVLDVTEKEKGLPRTYDLDKITEFWMARPLEVQKRLWQVSSRLVPHFTTIFLEKRTGIKKESEEQRRARAVHLRELLTSLGPAFIKLGQGLSVRPDLVGPEVMNELQQLCDSVPPFDDAIAMRMIEVELGRPVHEVFSFISPQPIAAASLGQVYRATLRRNGEQVAVKVQRPDMLRKVSLDLFVMRKVFSIVQVVQDRVSKAQTQFLPLFDEWATGTFRELDYINEGLNAVRFIELIRPKLSNVVVPTVHFEETSRKVLTTEWIDGQRLGDLPPEEVREMVSLGVTCFLTQLLDTGFFHADPHPGNLMVNSKKELVVLDFGLMSEVHGAQSDVFVASIIHLGNRDYPAVVDDFIKLDFLPGDVDREKVVPVLGAVLDQALEGGGAKAINFQKLSAQLSQITFDFPFKIPPYAALIIRALGVLEGIALMGNPKFKMIMEAFPYVAKRVMRTDTPLLRSAFRDIVYKDGYFSARRFQVLLDSSGGFLGDGDAFVDFDTPAEQSRDPTHAFEFFAGEDGQFVRSIVAEEIATSIDVLSRSSVRALRRLFVPPVLRGLPLPLLNNFFEPPQLSEEDIRHLVNIREMLNFLAQRRQTLTPAQISAAMPQLSYIVTEVVVMAAGLLSDRALRRTMAQWRRDGEWIAGQQRISLTGSRPRDRSL